MLRAMASTVAQTAHRSRPGLRLLAAVQLTITGGYLVGLAMFGYVHLRYGGGVDGVGGGSHDPKEFVPGGMRWWNPLTYLYLVAYLSVLLGWLFAALTVLASIPLLALRSSRPQLSASRKFPWTLVTGMVGVVAVTIVSFTSLGGMLGQWIAD
jgi:hypothetical protein